MCAQIRQLTVEVHDVCPAELDAAKQIVAQLRDDGVTRPVLLVIPEHQDHRGRCWPLHHHAPTRRWLEREQQDGAEIVQHGLTHRAPGPPPPGLRRWFMHHVFSRGCAEFAHLHRAAADARLRRGRQILARCGFSSAGFVAPAWQQSHEALQAVRDQGYTFTTFLNHVQRLNGPHCALPAPTPTPALTFAAPPAVDHGKRLVMRLLEARARQRQLLRVALHPEDLRGAQPIAFARDRIRRLLCHRELVTYAQWLKRR